MMSEIPMDGWRLPPESELKEQSRWRSRGAGRTWEAAIRHITSDYDRTYASSSGYAVNCRAVCFERGDDRDDMEMICVDLKTGSVYYSHEMILSGPGGSLIRSYVQEEMDWTGFLEIARSISLEVYAHYQGIDENGWERYLTKDMVEFRLW